MRTGWVLLSSLVLGLGLGRMAFADPYVYVRSSTLKVHSNQTALPPPLFPSPAAISAAQNEFEAFQVVVDEVDGTGLTVSDVQKPTLTHTDGVTTIEAKNIRIFREGLIDLAQPTPPPDPPIYSGEDLNNYPPGGWPDPLIPIHDWAPGFVVTNPLGVTERDLTTDPNDPNDPHWQTSYPLSAGGRVTFWVEVFVPDGQPSGLYTGTLTVDIQGANPISVPVSVIVHNFRLPTTSSLTTHMEFNYNGACVRHLGEDSDCAHEDINQLGPLSRAYARFMLQHRISMNFWHIAPTEATAHFADTYGDIVRGTDTSASLLLHGEPTACNTNGDCPSASCVNGLCQSSPKPSSLRFPWADFSASNGWDESTVASWWNLVGTNGWSDLTFAYIVDEPGGPNGGTWTDVNMRGPLVHANGRTDFRTLVTTTIQALTDPANMSSTGYVDLVVVNNPEMDNKAGNPLHGNQRGQYNSFASNSPKQVWMYQSCIAHGCNEQGSDYQTNWPNVMIDATGLQNRAEPWMHYIYGSSGLLYYNVARNYGPGMGTGGCPPGHIKDELDFQGSNLCNEGGNGDGTLVYPGFWNRPLPTSDPGKSTLLSTSTDSIHVPVASYRLKMIRDGLEDFEYLKLCENTSGRDGSAGALAIAKGNTGQAGDGLFPMTPADPQNNLAETGAMYSANDRPATPDPEQDANRLEGARSLLATCIAGVDLLHDCFGDLNANGSDAPPMSSLWSEPTTNTGGSAYIHRDSDGQGLFITPTAGQQVDLQVKSKDSYTLSGTNAQVSVFGVVGSGVTQEFSLGVDDCRRVAWQYSDNVLRPVYFTKSGSDCVSNSALDPNNPVQYAPTITYDAAQHGFWRIRHSWESPPRVYWETAPASDQNSWTVRGLMYWYIDNPFSIDSVRVAFRAFTMNGTAGSSASAKFRAFNRDNSVCPGAEMQMGMSSSARTWLAPEAGLV